MLYDDSLLSLAGSNVTGGLGDALVARDGGTITSTGCSVTRNSVDVRAGAVVIVEDGRVLQKGPRCLEPWVLASRDVLKARELRGSVEMGPDDLDPPAIVCVTAGGVSCCSGFTRESYRCTRLARGSVVSPRTLRGSGASG